MAPTAHACTQSTNSPEDAPRARRNDKPQMLRECVLAGLTGRFVSPGSPQAVRQERRVHAFRVLQGVGGGGAA